MPIIFNIQNERKKCYSKEKLQVAIFQILKVYLELYQYPSISIVRLWNFIHDYIRSTSFHQGIQSLPLKYLYVWMLVFYLHGYYKDNFACQLFMSFTYEYYLFVSYTSLEQMFFYASVFLSIYNM